MEDIKPLFQLLIEEFGKKLISRVEIPKYILENLNPDLPLRPYQEDALKIFSKYWEENFDGKPRQNHQLLFHMATGSGKTMMMAALILYLYEQGYRNFLFFVNNNNIIRKTKENFLNELSKKYLFKNEICFHDKQVSIRSVDNFQAVNPEDINIVFTTIQGLHTSLNTPRENALTYDDFTEHKIVLLSDEAHHINVDTKRLSKLSGDELFEFVSWENTVEKIFKANPNNVLLEFTATIDFNDESLNAKYKPKLIFDYPLKAFRQDGYSKEVKILQADLPVLQRALQAVLLSQYRLKVFEKYGLKIKPVVMFKSKTIKESKEFLEEFVSFIKRLRTSDLEVVQEHSHEVILKKAFSYFQKEGISFENLIVELQEDFSEQKIVSVNSKEESEEKQLLVNSLEERDNEIRAVFAVDKLNEGWDVLNLFDIVRLYNTRDARSGRFGKTTMSEAQLIGRGARYCPFRLDEDQPLFERKFDTDIEHPLRVGEELYYHSAQNSRYIQELEDALKEIGIRADETVTKKLKIKDSFKDTRFWKSGHIFLNEKIKREREEIDGLDGKVLSKLYKVSIYTGKTKVSLAFEAPVQAKDTATSISAADYKLTSFGYSVLHKAIQRLPFYEFSSLRSHLPNLNSIKEFITSERYLASINVEVSGLKEQVKNLTADQKLFVACRVLEEMSSSIASEKSEYIGTKEFVPKMIRDVFQEKELHFAIDIGGDKEFGRSMKGELTNYPMNLDEKDWFVFDDCYGTSEEKALIQFIDKKYSDLSRIYSQVYLIRNERHFPIFDFRDGSRFEPDFVLFLIGKKEGDTKHYQIFIEPKGGHLLKEDQWKQEFLESIKSTAVVEPLWENREYIIWGLPFFNSDSSKATEFNVAFQDLVLTSYE